MNKRFTDFSRSILCVLCSLFGLASGLVWGQPKFTDITDEAGVNHIFQVFQGTFGGGAAVLDYDQDGWEDLFIAGGAGADQLLQNQRDGTFKDVFREAGLAVLDGFVTQGAAVADVNRDGWPDIFVTTIAFVIDEGFEEAPNVLLINNGDGSFRDGSLAFNLVEKTFSTSASFGDVNRDGYPDLYVSNYFENFEGSLDAFSGPQTNGDTRPGKDLLYINDRGRTFIESAAAFGIEQRGLTFQAMWSDFDNDRDLDLLVINDFGNRTTPNLLYRNEYPEAAFTEIGEEKKFNYGINGMGIGACDINRDGWLDYLVTNIQISPFFINQGPDAAFVEESVRRGSGFATISTDVGVRITPVSWGVNFFDVDHDLDDDLYLTNGSLNPPLAPNPNLMLENDYGVFYQYGFAPTANDQSIGRGSVVFDYDLDGDLDLLVVNQTPFQNEDVGVEFKGTRLYRNDNATPNNWIKIKLKGRRSETNGIGSRVALFVGETMLLQEVYGGSSHASQNSTTLHFGLGPFAMVDSIKIGWSASGEQILTQIPAGQVLTVEEEAPATSEPLKDLRVYPNPFAHELWFDVPETIANHPAQAVLINAIGQTIATAYFPSVQARGNFISISSPISPGIYLLSLVGDGSRHVGKLVRGK